MFILIHVYTSIHGNIQSSTCDDTIIIIRFWILEVFVSAGKVGCKGRLFGAKQHAATSEASRHAKRQANAKIIEG